MRKFQSEPVKNESLRNKLSRFPPIFTLTHLKQCTPEMSDGTRRVIVHRLMRYGLLRSAGARSGLYYNMVADPMANEKHRQTALFHLFPSAVLGGMTILHNAGWITQIPVHLHVNILNNRKSFPRLDGVYMYLRRKSWYRSMIYFLDATYSVNALLPEAALADLVLYEQGTLPFDGEDLYITESQMKKTYEIARVLCPREFRKKLDPFMSVCDTGKEYGKSTKSKILLDKSVNGIIDYSDDNDEEGVPFEITVEDIDTYQEDVDDANSFFTEEEERYTDSGER